MVTENIGVPLNSINNRNSIERIFIQDSSDIIEFHIQENIATNTDNRNYQLSINLLIKNLENRCDIFISQLDNQELTLDRIINLKTFFLNELNQYAEDKIVKNFKKNLRLNIIDICAELTLNEAVYKSHLSIKQSFEKIDEYLNIRKREIEYKNKQTLVEKLQVNPKVLSVENLQTFFQKLQANRYITDDVNIFDFINKSFCLESYNNKIPKNDIVIIKWKQKAVLFTELFIKLLEINAFIDIAQGDKSAIYTWIDNYIFFEKPVGKDTIRTYLKEKRVQKPAKFIINPLPNFDFKINE